MSKNFVRSILVSQPTDARDVCGSRTITITRCLHIGMQISENKARTGLKFGYPDGYYRSQYPHFYSIPISATAALDLENEKRAPKESANGMPRSVGKLNFKEWLTEPR